MALTSQLGLNLAKKQAEAQYVAPTPVSTPASNSSSGTTKNVQTGQVFQNATTGPYTLQNAQSQGYDAEAAQRALAVRNAQQRAAEVKQKEATFKQNTAMAGSPVIAKASTASTASPYTNKTTGVATSTPTTLEGRLEAAKAKYGASDSRVQEIQRLMDLKKSRANNSTGAVIKNPDSSSLTSKIDTSLANEQVKEMQVSDRNENLQKDAIDTAAKKNDQKSNIMTDEVTDTNKATADYEAKYGKEFDDLKNEYASMQKTLEAREAEDRDRIEKWNKEQNDALSNRQMGNQAEATQKLGRLGASDTVLSNAQNEIRSNPIYQEQKATLQKNYIDTLSDTTKQYQDLYNTIVKSKGEMTESKRAVAEQLLNKINLNKEKISTLKQTGVDEMFKPVETFQAARLEDSNNAELSSKQNSEAQYRWAGMTESDRIAKLKDALYNYDPSVSRADLKVSDFESAAREGDITKAVSLLANTAKNYTRANSGGGYSGGSTGNRSTSNASTGTKKTSDSTAANSLAKSYIDKGYNTLEKITKALDSRSDLPTEQKDLIVNAFKEELGWKAPLSSGNTQYQNNASTEAYKLANNIK